MSTTLEIMRTGPLALIQDLGRPGLAQIGVTRSGAADRRSHTLANRLVANPGDRATIEVMFGGLTARVRGVEFQQTLAVHEAPVLKARKLATHDPPRWGDDLARPPVLGLVEPQRELDQVLGELDVRQVEGGAAHAPNGLAACRKDFEAAQRAG